MGYVNRWGSTHNDFPRQIGGLHGETRWSRARSSFKVDRAPLNGYGFHTNEHHTRTERGCLRFATLSITMSNIYTMTMPYGIWKNLKSIINVC